MDVLARRGERCESTSTSLQHPEYSRLRSSTCENLRALRNALKILLSYIAQSTQTHSLEKKSFDRACRLQLYTKAQFQAPLQPLVSFRSLNLFFDKKLQQGVIAKRKKLLIKLMIAAHGILRAYDSRVCVDLDVYVLFSKRFP